VTRATSSIWLLRRSCEIVESHRVVDENALARRRVRCPHSEQAEQQSVVRKPYAIPAGASVHKYGGLGYVGFAEEVRQQEKALGFAFDYIVVCTVTGSTNARMHVARLKPLTSRGWLPLARQFLGLSNLCGGHALCKLVSFFYRTFHAPRGR
jgi:1-aminocyclopropane-1-carboxylate deaminase/D-cysteine desulfhydrase-like pyridoxal-dependent ACC family enzyme